MLLNVFLGNNMEVLEIFYIALGTIGILLVLHIGTFWISRIMQPPKPKIVYVQTPTQAPAPQVPQVAYTSPVQPPAAPPPAPVQQQAAAPPVLRDQPVSIQLPTYDVPPPSTIPQNTSVASPMGSLPPPIETRSTTKQSSGDLGAPR